jgi:hypothetical protein
VHIVGGTAERVDRNHDAITEIDCVQHCRKDTHVGLYAGDHGKRSRPSRIANHAGNAIRRAAFSTLIRDLRGEYDLKAG